MKKLSLSLAVLLLLSVVLSACSAANIPETKPGKISVYRLVRPEYQTENELIASESVTYDNDADKVRELAQELKRTPENSKLMSALPANVHIVSAALKNRTVEVCLSDSYMQLDGVEKTVLDCCVTLSMCSIPNVDFVSIHAESEPVEIKLSSEDILLENTLISPENAKLRIYFPKAESDYLAAEYCSVNVEKETPEMCVINELLKGPQSDMLLPLPKDISLLQIETQDDGLCTVEFSADFLSSLKGDNTAIRLAVYSVVNSLASLASVNSVQIILKNSDDQMLGDVDISQPLTKKTSLIGSAIVE